MVINARQTWGCHANRLIENIEMSPHLTWYVCPITPKSCTVQHRGRLAHSRLAIKGFLGSGPDIKWELISKLSMDLYPDGIEEPVEPEDEIYGAKESDIDTSDIKSPEFRYMDDSPFFNRKNITHHHNIEHWPITVSKIYSKYHLFSTNVISNQINSGSFYH